MSCQHCYKCWHDISISMFTHRHHCKPKRMLCFMVVLTTCGWFCTLLCMSHQLVIYQYISCPLCFHRAHCPNQSILTFSIEISITQANGLTLTCLLVSLTRFRGRQRHYLSKAILLYILYT